MTAWRTPAVHAAEPERPAPVRAAAIGWEDLPRIESHTHRVFTGEQAISGFNHHPTLVWYGGRCFAAWSSGARDEDAGGQRVMYATSADGVRWSPAQPLTAGEAGLAYTPCGFWIRQEGLFALAARRSARGAAVRPDNPLLAYRWDAAAERFTLAGPVLADFFAHDAPRRLPDGSWLMLGKPGRPVPGGRTLAARGESSTFDRWSFVALPSAELGHDAFWQQQPDGTLTIVEAAGTPPQRWLQQFHSRDGGGSWTAAGTIGLSDADSRLAGLRLSSGSYVLVSNPNPTRYRVPLTVAASRDGKGYDRVAMLRGEPTNKRFPGHAKAPGYQYPRVVEHGGDLWVVYSVNKEDIEVSRVPLGAIERLAAMPPLSYPERYDAVVVDNTDPAFAAGPGWRSARTLPGFTGEDYAMLPAGTRGWARWTLRAAQTGIHRVALRWVSESSPSRSVMASIVPVTVIHPGGEHHTSVDQSRYGGSWIAVAEIPLRAGEELVVRLEASGDGVAAADAARLLPITRVPLITAGP